MSRVVNMITNMDLYPVRHQAMM